ncbi:regulatory protein RecX [Halomonas sp. CUBES01]|uniref:Regulatory protein RecX n=1 Tax=Vreelandella gomseomensis TaxID=370766 RepID=A0ABU1GGU9_9GAMM|nr:MULTISPECIES: regulatory protein RecX [Halomonas]MDR5876338.1 regulatory protein RecX [Halomonas gomseomensis]MEC4766408.1 regulatory protein RecX [Halomonas sp. CUBES01]
MLSSSQDATPREVAIQLLARREYSRAELVRKLEQKAFAADDIDACLDALVEQGLQSDVRFAETFIRSRINRGQGVIRIQGELRQRGVDREIATEAFAVVEEREGVDWFELARETLARRFASPGDTPKERAKRERFLATRGFNFDQIRYALDAL